jgi:RNase P/RNase MRP subunit p29
MNTASFSRTILRNLLGAGLICIAFAFVTNAQVQTQTEVETGPATREVRVRSGEVVYVSGNHVIIRGDDGIYRDFPNVPDSETVTVDGQELSVHDLRPGMTIQRISITTTRPRVITTIKSVTGTVWSINPPTSVILTLEDGKNQEFTIPDGTKFTVDGQPTDAFSLKPGMKVSATSVTEVPETVVRKRVKLTGEMPPPPDVALLVILVPVLPPEETAATAPPDTTSAETAPAQTAAATPGEATPAQLPKTGSSLPLVGLLGALFCSFALGLKARRSFSACPVVSRKNRAL